MKTAATTAQRSIRFNSGRLAGEYTEVMRVLTATKKIAADCNAPEIMEEVAGSLADIAAFMSAKAAVSKQFTAWFASAKHGDTPLDFPPLHAAMDEYEAAYEKVQFI